MPADSSIRHRGDASHARPLSSQRRLRVATEHLRLGMFVVELDRPWSDTPFLIQGFAVDSDIELSTLRRYCRQVFVDLERSSPESADLLRALGPLALEGSVIDPDTGTDTGTLFGSPSDVPDTGTMPSGAPLADGGTRSRAPARTYQARSDVHISRETRRRFRQLVSGAAPAAARGSSPDSMSGRALTRLRRLFGAPGGTTAHAGTSRSLPAALREELVAALPTGERLRTWTARHGAADEMPRARQAFARAEKTLAGLLDEIRNGAPPRLDRIEVAARHLADSMIDNPDALLWVAQRREEPLQPHQQGVRVGLYMIALARRLGLPRDPMARAAMVGMLADVGKSRLPRALLEKPGMLNPAEYGIVKEHVRLGLEMLAEGGNPGADVMLGIAQHHERLDGSGYPKGLREGEIGLFGRMAAIADSYAGLTTPRAYASPLAPQDALMNLFQWAGSSFDVGLVEQFVQAIGVFPVGSLVELSGGEIAVVREQHPGRPLEPRVRLLTWPDRRPLAVPIEADLHRSAGADGGLAPAPGRIVRGLPSGSARVSGGSGPAEEPVAR